jgi:Post-segregation antitoxin (ccd killing mechanism protein) encoded by the F plasmid
MVCGLVSGYPLPMSQVALKVQIDLDLVAEAERLGVDISRASQAGVEHAVILKRSAAKSDAERAANAEAWAAEHAEAIADHNRRVEERGILSDYFPPRWL